MGRGGDWGEIDGGVGVVEWGRRWPRSAGGGGGRRGLGGPRWRRGRGVFSGVRRRRRGKGRRRDGNGRGWPRGGISRRGRGQQWGQRRAWDECRLGFVWVQGR